MSAGISKHQRITLRPSGDEDQDFIFSVFCTARAARFGNALMEEQQLQPLLAMQYRAQQFQYQQQYPQAQLDVVLLADKAVGYIHIEREQYHCTLIDIALLPETIGNGVGSYLVAELIREARIEGKSVLASVDKCNTPAWQLWLRLGFEVVADNGVYLAIECRPTT